ncbi:SusD/RagB family nutrient-binding outer membrane lipoprotein [Alistipes timonensis]|uniref:SusD/RagB family nutrient-binding outer membrane lipoprotein n=1 Tax=Alistipes timonensis TaxID=1465754 RepID=UPI002430AD32|nr:SusD/RagB family nutrient-binding outer membrane lipoprotein [Alistipes timonensis]
MSRKMKIYQTIMAVLLAVFIVAAQSCTGDFERINTNPDQVTPGQTEVDYYNVGSKIKVLQGLVVDTQEHLHQFYELMVGCAFGGYAGETPDGWHNKFITGNPDLEWQKGPFKTTYKETYPAYRSLKRLTEDPVPLALADIIRVAIMHRVTDTYGPIPYTKMVENGNDALTAAYDSQEVVYMAMLEELKTAWDALNANSNLPSDALSKYDGVYQGDVKKWMKFCASLQLRIAMRMSLVKPDKARQYAEDAITKGVITDNADNAYLRVAENRSALCWNDWNDHRIAAEILCYMNGYNDNRRSAMFTTVGDTYVGIRRGIFTTNKEKATKLYSNMLIKSTDHYLWMNAAEITLLRAEGAWNGWAMGGDPQTLYEKGVRLSFDEYKVSGADSYLLSQATPSPYNNPENMYNAGAPSDITPKWEDIDSPTSKARNYERIITQKWIALFPNGLEAWAEYRRTGYPKLFPIIENQSGGTINDKWGARRLNYPVDEYQENGANVNDAVSKYLNGRDNMGTRVWWDTKELK